MVTVHTPDAHPSFVGQTWHVHMPSTEHGEELGFRASITSVEAEGPTYAVVFTLDEADLMAHGEDGIRASLLDELAARRS